MLYAPDGSCFLPDFTITWNGDEYYWGTSGNAGCRKLCPELGAESAVVSYSFPRPFDHPLKRQAR